MAAAKKKAKTVEGDLDNLLRGLQGLLNDYFGDDAYPEDDEDADEDSADEVEDEDDEDSEDDEDEDEEDERAAYKAELEAMKIADLRKAAIKAGFGKSDVADAKSEDLVISLIEDKFDSEEDADDDEDEDDEDADESADSADDEEDEDEEDDEDDEESDEYTREDLEDLTLAALKKVAKEEFEVAPADLKGLDKDGVLDLLFEDDEESDDEDDDEDEAEEDEEEPYTKDELDDMSLSDLKQIASDWELKIKAGARQSTYVKAILDAQDAEDEDEE